MNEKTMSRVIDVLDSVEKSEEYKMRVAKSLDYLGKHNLQAMSNEVPDELLSWWIAEWNTEETDENQRSEFSETCKNCENSEFCNRSTDDFVFGDKTDKPLEEDIIEIDEQSLSNYENLSVFGKVFMAVMFARQDKDSAYFLRTKETSPQAILHAAELTRYVQLSRKENRRIPDFDIFDVERYDETMQKLGGK